MLLIAADSPVVGFLILQLGVLYHQLISFGFSSNSFIHQNTRARCYRSYCTCGRDFPRGRAHSHGYPYTDTLSCTPACACAFAFSCDRTCATVCTYSCAYACASHRPFVESYEQHPRRQLTSSHSSLSHYSATDSRIVLSYTGTPPVASAFNCFPAPFVPIHF